MVALLQTESAILQQALLPPIQFQLATIGLSLPSEIVDRRDFMYDRPSTYLFLRVFHIERIYLLNSA
jgi:hypothetical protein